MAPRNICVARSKISAYLFGTGSWRSVFAITFTNIVREFLQGNFRDSRLAYALGLCHLPYGRSRSFDDRIELVAVDAERRHDDDHIAQWSQNDALLSYLTGNAHADTGAGRVGGSCRSVPHQLYASHHAPLPHIAHVRVICGCRL